MGVLLEEGIGDKLAGLAAGAAEEIAVDVVGDAGRFDIIMQTLIEAMMTGDVVFRLSHAAAPNGGAPGQNSRQPSSE